MYQSIKITDKAYFYQSHPHFLHQLIWKFEEKGVSEFSSQLRNQIKHAFLGNNPLLL